MSDQSDGTDQQLFSGQVVQMLVRHIRASFEDSGRTPQEVSQAFQATSESLAHILEDKRGNSQTPISESIRDQLYALMVNMTMWAGEAWLPDDQNPATVEDGS